MMIFVYLKMCYMINYKSNMVYWRMWYRTFHWRMELLKSVGSAMFYVILKQCITEQLSAMPCLSQLWIQILTRNEIK